MSCIKAALQSHWSDVLMWKPVNGFDVHLQAVSTGGSMAALLAYKWLFSAMFGRFVHSQLGPT